MPSSNEQRELSALLSRPFLGACSIIIVLLGGFGGFWLSGVRENLAKIFLILDSRADIPWRTAELERREADKERRLQEIEREHWTSRAH